MSGFLNSKIAQAELQKQIEEQAMDAAQIETLVRQNRALRELSSEYLGRIATLELELKLAQMRLEELEAQDGGAGS